MNHYCQHDYQDRLGTCNTTISDAGCFVTSLAMLDGRTPPEVNNLLRDNGGYSNGCNMISDRAAEILGLEYNGKTTDYQASICIAETDHYKSKGYPQHFFVWLGNGEIHDPLLDFGPTVNNYNIVSFRLFKPKTNQEDFMTDAKLHDMLRDHVDWFYRTLFHRAPTNDEIESHVSWIMRDSGDSYNFKGLRNWDEGNVQDPKGEFKANWINPKDCPKADCSVYINKIEQAKKDLA